MKNKEEIFLNLANCSEEERKEVIAMLPQPQDSDDYDIIDNDYQYLIFDDYYERNCWWVVGTNRLNNKTEVNLQDFKEIMGAKVQDGWIKIESETDLPKETCALHVYPNYLERGIFFFYDDELSRDELMENHTHYQPIIKPEPPTN